MPQPAASQWHGVASSQWHRVAASQWRRAASSQWYGAWQLDTAMIFVWLSVKRLDKAHPVGVRRRRTLNGLNRHVERSETSNCYDEETLRCAQGYERLLGQPQNEVAGNG